MAEWAKQLFGASYQDLSAPHRAGYALMTGTGGGLGMFVGNVSIQVSSYLFLLFKDGQTPYFDSPTVIKDSALYGLAAFVTDTIWQPIVQILLNNRPFDSITGVTTGLCCGLAFFMTLMLVRFFIIDKFCSSSLPSSYRQNEHGEYVYQTLHPKHSLLLSKKENFWSKAIVLSFWNVMLTTWVFIYTQTNVGHDSSTGVSPSFLRIEDHTPVAHALSLAVQARSIGYGISAIIEIFFQWMMKSGCGEGTCNLMGRLKSMVILPREN